MNESDGFDPVVEGAKVENQLSNMTEEQVDSASERIVSRAGGALATDGTLRVEDPKVAEAMAYDNKNELEELSGNRATIFDNMGFLERAKRYIKGDGIPRKLSEEEKQKRAEEIKNGVPFSGDYADEVALGAATVELTGGEPLDRHEAWGYSLGKDGKKLADPVFEGSELARSKMAESVGQEELDRLDKSK